MHRFEGFWALEIVVSSLPTPHNLKNLQIYQYRINTDFALLDKEPRKALRVLDFLAELRVLRVIRHEWEPLGHER